MASENNEPSKTNLYGEAATGRNNRGRSRNNGKGPKKVPQRGVGVEQLERMRLQKESLRKVALESASGNFVNINPHHHLHQQVVLNYGVLSSTSSKGSFQFPNQNQQMIINDSFVASGSSGFTPFVGNKNGSGSGSGYGVGASSSNVGYGWFVPNNQQNNRVVGNGNNYGSFVRNPFEISSKELSSIPNLNHQSLDLCLKKTRLNEENVMMRGTNGRREMPLEVWNHVHHRFMPPQHQPSVVSAYDPTQNLDEVVAVHRRGDSSLGSSKVFMEYEFFPGKDERVAGTIAKDLLPTTTNSIGFGSGEASSSITVTSYGETSTAYDSIDLSLRL